MEEAQGTCLEQHQDDGRREEVTRNRDLVGHLLAKSIGRLVLFPIPVNIWTSFLCPLDVIFHATVIHNIHKRLKWG